MVNIIGPIESKVTMIDMEDFISFVSFPETFPTTMWKWKLTMVKSNKNGTLDADSDSEGEEEERGNSASESGEG